MEKPNSKLRNHFFRLFLVIILSMASFSSFADGGYCWIYKVKIEIGNKSIIGYAKGNMWNFEKDSLNNSGYFTRALTEYSNSQAIDSAHQFLYLFEEMIPLKIPNPFNERSTMDFEINHLIGRPQSIPTATITRISYMETIECTMGSAIITPISLSDSLWLQTKPSQILRVGDGFCSYTIYVFDANLDLQSKIEKWAKLIENDDKEALEGRDYGSSFRDEIRKLGLKKIVILAHCSC